MSKAARISADDTLPSAIIRAHIIPMLDREAVLCTKRYLSSLEHAEHWLQYRSVIVQLMCCRNPAEGFYGEGGGQVVGWEDFNYRLCIMDMEGDDSEGVRWEDVLQGYHEDEFACEWFGTPCHWFTGQPFHTIGNTKRIKQRLCNNQFVDPRSVFTRKYIGMCVQTNTRVNT